jgi:hypothetical protein
MMCPEHHHQLYAQVGPTVYCEECNHAYRYGDLIDKKETQSRSVIPSSSSRVSTDHRE